MGLSYLCNNMLQKNLDKLTPIANSFNNSNTIDNLTKGWPPLFTYLIIINYEEKDKNPPPKSVQYFTGVLPPPQPNNFAHLCNEILDEEYGYNYNYNS